MLLAVLLFAGDGDAAITCTGCAKPSFGPSALPFPGGQLAAKGDFNNDGLLDVATAYETGGYPGNPGGTLVIAVNLGTGGGAMVETARTTLPLAPGSSYLVALGVGDFDRDGKLDLVVSRSIPSGNSLSAEILLYRGDGAGGFAPLSQVTLADWSASFAIADFDGDGRLDLAVGSAGQILLFRGVGDGSFQPPRSIATGGGVFVAADFDLDGRPDLVVGSPNGLSVLLNGGAAGFRVAFEIPDRPSYGHSLAVGDVDGNGTPDLIVAASGLAGGVDVFYGFGDGTFEGPVSRAVGGNAYEVAVGDFNRDGRADVVANGVVLVADTFGVLQETTSLPSSGSPLVGDFDGDGFDDIAVTGGYAITSSLPDGALYLGNGDGTFRTPRVLSTGSVTSPSLIDLNKDGKVDLAWIDYNVGFGSMLGDGAGGFSPAVTTPFALPFAAGVFADVTGDGIPDAVVETSDYLTQTIFVLPGDGTGHFGSPITTAVGTNEPVSPPVVADFDGDGHADVAFFRSGQLVVLLGDGTGHFPVAKPALAVPPGALRVSDLNGDGKPDLVVIGPGGDIGERVVTLVNDGTGSFTIAANLAFSFYAPATLVRDADGDGKPDLLTVGYQMVTFRKGDGLGGFGNAVDTPVADSSRLVAADFDGDGKLDLLTGFSMMTVLKGNGDGTFIATGVYPLPYEVKLAGDVNGDGKPDLLGTFNAGTWLVLNTTCEARRLQLDAWLPSCGAAGTPFATQPTLRVFDDAGNPVLCETNPVTASITSEAGPAGALLRGTTSIPVSGGVARFSDLSIDKAGGGYRVRFDLAGARGAATPLFSQSLPQPVIVGPAQACATSSTRFDGGPDADAWIWTLDGTTVGTQRFLTLPPLPSGSHALGLSILKDLCASATSLTLLVAAAVPTPAASSNSPVPFGGILQLHAAAVAGATYRWTGPNGFVSSLQNPAIPAATDPASGRYQVVASVGACSSTASATDVVILPSSCRGCPNASFSPAIRALPVPAAPVRLALADFDGDGIVDIVAAHSDFNGNGAISFLRGLGHGGFKPPVESAPLYHPGAMATADLDGNGLRDVVIAGYPDISVVLQTAPGHFSASASHLAGAVVSDIAIADVNGDGFPDILAANSPFGGFGLPPSPPGTVSVFLGDGAGGFGAPTSVPVERAPAALLVRDINGDGRADLLVANRDSSTVSVFLGDGAGGFAPHATLAVPGSPVSLAMGDVTGDATPDLVVGLVGAEALAAIFEGSAAGSFAFVRAFPINMDSQLALADLDRDGHPDLVTLASGSIWVYRGEGAAVFSSPASYAQSALGNTLAIGDFNSDGIPDVIVAVAVAPTYPPASRVALLAGDGRGGFPQLPSLGSLSEPVTALKALDMNADGYPDILTLDRGKVDLFLADGAGGFTLKASMTPPSPFSPDSFVAGDVNGDGIPDVIEIDEYGGRVAVFRGLGSGLFDLPVITTVGSPILLLGSGDLDGDGRTDLIVGGFYSVGPNSVLLGNSASGFGAPIDLPGNRQVSAAAIGDFNGDGKSDVIVTCFNPFSVLVYLWNGSGFSAPLETPLDVEPNAVAIGDFDGDGKLDVVVSSVRVYSSSQPSPRFLPGNGAGGFGPARAFGPSQVAGPLLAADFNGDGKLDLAAVLKDATTVAIFVGDGHGGFAAASEYAAGAVGPTLAAADLDRDGRPDLVFVQAYPAAVRILFNSNCVPSRLGVTSNPSCAAQGQPFAAEVSVLDDGGNVVACDSAALTIGLVQDTGAPGAVLSGTSSVTAVSGAARFADLALDRDGRRFQLEFHHPLATAARSAPFSVGAPPVPSITGPPQLCAGTSSWAAPPGYDTYAWSIDGTPFSSSRTVTPTVLAAGNHLLGLSVTRDRCEASASTTVSNAPPRLTSITPVSGVSQGGTLVSVAGACFAPGAALSLDGSTTTWGTTSPTALPALTAGHVPAIVDAVLANPDGQSATMAGAYTYVCDEQPPAVSNNSPVCAGVPLRLSGPYIPGATYAWIGPNGFKANSQYVYMAAPTVEASGDYTLNVTNVFGCSLPPATTTVVVRPGPSAAITAPASVTAWSTGNTASIPDAGPGAFYSWYVLSNATITSDYGSNVVTFTAGVSGDITLRVTVYGATCATASTRTVAIGPKATKFYPITPCRLADTRQSDAPSGGPALSAGALRAFPVAGLCGIPDGAVAVSLNAAVTGPTSGGSLRIFATGTNLPPTTSHTFSAGQTRANNSTVMLGSDGKLFVITTQGAGTTHVILDANGYFK